MITDYTIQSSTLHVEHTTVSVTRRASLLVLDVADVLEQVDARHDTADHTLLDYLHRRVAGLSARGARALAVDRGGPLLLAPREAPLLGDDAARGEGR